MRVDRLRIGSSKDGPAHRFRNLKDVCIDFDQNDWISIVIGWNGTGKSNVLEALAIIFRELIFAKRPTIEFSFELAYRIGPPSGQRHVEVRHDPETKGRFQLVVKDVVTGEEPSMGRKLSMREFRADDRNLPKYVFSYYSGESSRMKEVFEPYTRWYDEQLRTGADPGPKRLFYALPIHSQFVLLAFLMGGSEAADRLLREHLGVDPETGFASALFVLSQPPWPPRPNGDPRFWGAIGVVTGFLDRLQSVALAPIFTKRKVKTTLWNTTGREFKYMFVKDIAALRQLVEGQSPARFFRDLESTYVSELIEEVRIKLQIEESDGTVTFRELSEGEQQLLTVLGLLRFTAEQESLFLLDEPDTHLNPQWSVRYLDFLRDFIGQSGENESSHVIMTTHNPIAIAELSKQQVQILHNRIEEGKRRVVASFPEEDPRGMGYASIVTSDMFGIASHLDRTTQLKLERQRQLSSSGDLDDHDVAELSKIEDELKELGFRFFYPDDEYSRYLRLRHEAMAERFRTTDADELAAKAVEMTRDEREALARRLVPRTLDEEEQNEA